VRLLLRVALGLGMLALACGAGSASHSASAKPRPVPAAKPTPRAPAALPISEQTVERVKLVWEAAAGGKGRAVAIHRGARRVAVANGSPVVLYDLGTGKRVSALASCTEVVRGGLGFVSGKLVVVCESALELYDAGKSAKLPAPRIAAARVTAASISGSRIALGHHDGVVRIYSLEGAPTIEIPVPGPPIDVKSLELTRDGKKIAVAWIQGSIRWWETAQPKVFHELVRHENESDSVAFSDDGTLFAEEGRTAHTTVWAFASPPAEKLKLKNGAWLKRLLFTRDARWLVRGGSDGLELAQLGGPKRVVLDTRGAVEDVTLDELGAGLAAVDRDGRLTVWAAR
jgi:hypothetical protein